MALISERMEWCGKKVLDTAGVVREAMCVFLVACSTHSALMCSSPERLRLLGNKRQATLSMALEQPAATCVRVPGRYLVSNA